MGNTLCTACPEAQAGEVAIPTVKRHARRKESVLRFAEVAEVVQEADEDGKCQEEAISKDDKAQGQVQELDDQHQDRSQVSSKPSNLFRSNSMSTRFDRLPTYIDPHKGLRPQHSVSDMSGQVRDVYNIVSELGRGSFGVVSKVQNRDTQEGFALKTIPVVNVEDRKTFERELDISRRLRHPYVVELFQTFKDDEAYHLVMDLCTGGDCLQAVSDTLQGEGPAGLATNTVAQYIYQMLNGIAYVHGYQFAHRDIKTENYLRMSPADNAPLKLIDFGLARSFEQGCPMKSKVGTASYVAPEVMGQDGYYERCDIWSIGVTAFVLASGSFPFGGSDEQEVIRNVMRGSYEFSHPTWKRHPQDLRDLISHMMTKDPCVRPPAKAILETSVWLRDHGDPQARKRSSRFGEGGQASCCSLQ